MKSRTFRETATNSTTQPMAKTMVFKEGFGIWFAIEPRVRSGLMKGGQWLVDSVTPNVPTKLPVIGTVHCGQQTLDSSSLSSDLMFVLNIL